LFGSIRDGFMLGTAYQNSCLCLDGRTSGCHGSGIKNDLQGFQGKDWDDIKEVEDVSQVQEWNKWDLDAVYPMNYNDFYLKGPEWVGEVNNEEVTAVNGSKPIYSGLFICPNPENKTKENDPE